MPFPTLPDRRVPYDNDGSVFALGSSVSGVMTYPTGSQAIYCNGLNATSGAYDTSGPKWTTSDGGKTRAWLFFPEQREVTAFWMIWAAFSNPVVPNDFGVGGLGVGGIGNTAMFGTGFLVEGSNDTTDGMDGTWETASLGGTPAWNDIFAWRSGIVTISFTGPKQTVRFTASNNTAGASTNWLAQLHIYGQKAAGQTPDDILFLNGNTSYAEFTAPEDFGDIPLGSTATRTFKVKNASATKTANLVNLQCNDPDFIISSDGTTWVVTINISSLAAGASSVVLYVRDTAPNIGSHLGPRTARIVATVGSWT